MNNRIENRQAEKKRVPAATRGLIGAIVGLVIMAVFIICFDAWATANGEYVDKTRYLGMLAVAPLYGFGYAFGYKKMAGWFATSLHYSGGIMGAAFIWWVLTGSKKGFLRGLMLIMIMFGLVAGAAWVPGIPIGIREIRKERKERALEDAQNRQENRERKREERARQSEIRQEKKQQKQYEAAEAHRLEVEDYHYSGSNPEWSEDLSEKKVQNAQPSRVYSAPANSVPAAENAAQLSVPPVQVPLPGSKLLCFGGEFAGGSFDLADGKMLVIGRDPGQSNIVVSGSNISRAHCMVRYSAANKCGLVKDISTNGTSFLDGTPVPKGEFVRVESGNGIRIGTNGPVFLFS